MASDDQQAAVAARPSAHGRILAIRAGWCRRRGIGYSVFGFLFCLARQTFATACRVVFILLRPRGVYFAVEDFPYCHLCGRIRSALARQHPAAGIESARIITARGQLLAPPLVLRAHAINCYLIWQATMKVISIVTFCFDGEAERQRCLRSGSPRLSPQRPTSRHDLDHTRLALGRQFRKLE